MSKKNEQRKRKRHCINTIICLNNRGYNLHINVMNNKIVCLLCWISAMSLAYQAIKADKYRLKFKRKYSYENYKSKVS